MKIATLLASAAVAVSLAGAASAQQGGAAPATPPAATWPKAEYVSIPMEIAVNKPAAEVWAKVGGYCDISKWIAAGREVPCVITSGKGEVGTVRTIAGRVVEVMTAKSEFVVVNGAMDSKATMSVAGGSMEVVSVGGVMYMKGLIKSKDGKPWVKIDPNGTDEFSKRMAPQLKSAADLRSQVEVYEGSKATLIGTDAGVRHYRLTGVSSAPAQPFDIYLDASDLPVKVTTKSDSMEMTITYSGFGDAVTVTAPPAAQVGPPPAM